LKSLALLLSWIISSQVSYNMLAISSFKRSPNKAWRRRCVYYYVVHSLHHHIPTNVYTKVVFLDFSFCSIDFVIIECWILRLLQAHSIHYFGYFSEPNKRIRLSSRET
jgi:hypothetical protein